MFRFDQKNINGKSQIPSRLTLLTLISFQGKKKFQSKLMGRGRASALKVYAHAYKCQKINLFKYSRVIHQKKRLEPLMNEQKSV